MNKYYIEDEEGYFWCQEDFGYWSKFESSKKYRFQGSWLYVAPLYFLMKISKVKARMVKI